jgi:MFS transporter, PAT family, beta-lactamase induction signal transducer AmpG
MAAAVAPPASPYRAPRPADPGPTFLSRLAAAPWVVSTYFAEGLPFSLVRQLSSELFTSLGASVERIGATSLYGLAWNLKLLWSPLIDRHGTIRRWLVVVEALVGLVVMGVAWRAGEQDLGGVARVLVVVAFLAATHDVAIDGFYLEALDQEGQATFAGLRITAYKWALYAGKLLLMLAGALQLAGWARPTAWRATFVVAGAALLLMAGGHGLLLPRPPRRALDGPPPRYLDAFGSFLRQSKVGASLAFILFYKAGDSLLFAMNAPFLKSLGFGDLKRGAVGLASGVVVTVASLVTGPLIARYGLRRALTPIAAVQSAAILLYAAVALTHPPAAVVSAVVVVEQLVSSVGDLALAIFLMRRCASEHKAAHYAIGTALMSVASTGAGVASGFLVTSLGYPTFFAVAFAASIPGVILTLWVPKE